MGCNGKRMPLILQTDSCRQWFPAGLHVAKSQWRDALLQHATRKPAGNHWRKVAAKAVKLPAQLHSIHHHLPTSPPGVVGGHNPA